MADKLALVFTGGGAKGAFSVGVLAGMVEAFPALRWSVVTGESTGSLIAPLAALGAEDRAQIGRLERIYRTARKRMILDCNLDLRHLLRFKLPDGLYNMGPLAELLTRELPDELLARLSRSDVATVACAVNLLTGRLALCVQDQFAATLRAYYDDFAAGAVGHLPIELIPFSKHRELLVASSAIPFAVEPARIDGAPLVDGGVREFAPLRPAIALGATHAIVVSTNPLDPAAPESAGRNLLRIGLRALDLLEDEVLRGDLAVASAAAALRDAAPAHGLDVPAFVGALRGAAPAGRGLPGRLVEYLSSALAAPPVLIAPAAPLGEAFDFDSTVTPEWPARAGADSSGSQPIMDARVDYGRRTIAQSIVADAALRRVLERFSAAA